MRIFCKKGKRMTVGECETKTEQQGLHDFATLRRVYR